MTNQCYFSLGDFCPDNFTTLSLDNLEEWTSQLLCGNPADRTTERHYVRPGAGRAELPRVTMFSRPVVAENTITYCLFARCSGSTIVWSSAAFQQTLFSFKPHSLMFPFVSGNSFIDRLSTAFVSDISQWSRACCMVGIFNNYDPVHAVWWGVSTELYCVNQLFTSQQAQLRPRVIAVLRCSAEHLRIVSPQPRSPTRRWQSIDVYDLPQLPTLGCFRSATYRDFNNAGAIYCHVSVFLWRHH